MKILIASDTHGDIDGLIDSLAKEKFDMLFYLGDYVRDGIEIAKILDIPHKIVRGNGDQDVLGFKDEEIFHLKDKKIFLTHGHKYNVSFGLDNLYYRSKEIGADYTFFGHTHVPIIEKLNGIILINPGSPTRPRSSDREKTFAIVELGKVDTQRIIKIN